MLSLWRMGVSTAAVRSAALMKGCESASLLKK